MAARKYGIVRTDHRNDQRWHVEGGRDIESGVAGFVTAYDSRDVDPLVEAAQGLVDALDTAEKLAAGGESQEANVNRVLTAAVSKARTALAPFNSEEEK